MYSIVLESYAHDAERMALLGSFVIMRSPPPPPAKSRTQTFMTPSGEGARYDRYAPSGESLGETFSGLPKRTSRGMSSSEVVRAPCGRRSGRRRRRGGWGEASTWASEEAASDVIGEGGGATKANADPRRRRGRSSCRSERWRLLLSIIFIGDIGWWEGGVSQKNGNIAERILMKNKTETCYFLQCPVQLSAGKKVGYPSDSGIV